MKMGRPKINNTRKAISCRVDPETYEYLKGRIDGMGRGIDFLYTFLKKRGQHVENNNISEKYIRNMCNKFADMLLRGKGDG